MFGWIKKLFLHDAGAVDFTKIEDHIDLTPDVKRYKGPTPVEQSETDYTRMLSTNANTFASTMIMMDRAERTANSCGSVSCI